MRILRILGVVVGGVLGVIALAAVAAWLFIDPNDYKDRIAQGVKSATGRELVLDGELRLTLFPWLALELGPASLGNPAGFGDGPFATVQRAKLRVKLMPLLRRELQVGRIEIDGLDLRLAQDAGGKGNWEDFGQQAQPEPAAPAEAPSAARVELEGVTVRDSRVSFEDLLVQGLAVDIGPVRTGQPFDVKFAGELVPGPGEPPLPVSLASRITLDLAAARYGLTATSLAGTLPQADGRAPVEWRFTAAQLDVDLAAQTLAAPAFEATLAAARVSGSLAGQQIVDAPRFAGEFVLEPLAPRELMQAFGVEAPITRDGKVLASLAARGSFRYAGDDFDASGLAVKLDDSQLSGSFGTHLGSGALRFDLALDRIDLDRYLPPPTEAAAGKEEPFELPVEALKPLLAKGQLAIGEARFSGMALSQVRVGVEAGDGLTRIAPARARLYGGEYAGEITVDTRPQAPRLTLDQTLTGIDVAQLMNDMLDTRRLSGRGKVVTRLTASGRNSDALVRTLDGTVVADLTDGAVEGLDVWYAIAQAQSLVQKRQLAGGENTGRTAFDTFHASATLQDGVATTRDLNITSQLLRITGAGSTNLVTQGLDYQVTATVLKEPPGDAALAPLARAAIPVKITGSLTDPKIRPDLAGMAKARLKQEVEERREEIKQKVEDKVKDRLRGLFNR